MAVTEDLTDAVSLTDAASPAGVLRLLQQAARTIDHMWHAAQSDGRHPAAVALGEASHGIHRALIALQADGAV